MSARAARLVVMMARPPVLVTVWLFAAIGAAQAGRGGGLHPLFTVIPLIVGGWFVHATVRNDLGDEPIDRVNLAHARGRPLVSGYASRAELLRLGRAAAAVALVAALAVDRRAAVVVAAGLALNIGYSRRPVRLCDRGGLASFLLPLGYVVIPYLVGLFSVGARLRGGDVALLAGLYVVFVGRILLKDFRDVRGDALFGKRTFLLRHGPEATCRLSAACWIAGSAGLLALAPVWSPVTLAVAAMLGLALYGLRQLTATRDPVDEQVVIGAIAVAGRGMAVALLAHLVTAHHGWPVPGEAAVLAALVAVYALQYTATLALRQRHPAVVPY